MFCHWQTSCLIGSFDYTLVDQKQMFMESHLCSETSRRLHGNCLAHAPSANSQTFSVNACLQQTEARKHWKGPLHSSGGDWISTETYFEILCLFSHRTSLGRNQLTKSPIFSLSFESPFAWSRRHPESPYNLQRTQNPKQKQNGRWKTELPAARNEEILLTLIIYTPWHSFQEFQMPNVEKTSGRMRNQMSNQLPSPT